jgi:hypothetical protein
MVEEPGDWPPAGRCEKEIRIPRWSNQAIGRRPACVRNIVTSWPPLPVSQSEELDDLCYVFLTFGLVFRVYVFSSFRQDLPMLNLTFWECFLRVGQAFTNAIDMFLISSPVCGRRTIKAAFDVPIPVYSSRCLHKVN